MNIPLRHIGWLSVAVLVLIVLAWICTPAPVPAQQQTVRVPRAVALQLTDAYILRLEDEVKYWRGVRDGWIQGQDSVQVPAQWMSR